MVDWEKKEVSREDRMGIVIGVLVVGFVVGFGIGIGVVKNKDRY
jgi:predicted transporter